MTWKRRKTRDVSLVADVELLLVVICQSWLMNQQPFPPVDGGKALNQGSTPAVQAPPPAPASPPIPPTPSTPASPATLPSPCFPPSPDTPATPPRIGWWPRVKKGRKVLHQVSTLKLALKEIRMILISLGLRLWKTEKHWCECWSKYFFLFWLFVLNRA